MVKNGEFTSCSSGHNPEKSIHSYQTDNGKTLKFTNNGKSMSLYDRDPSDRNHAVIHVTNNGDGTFSIKSHGPDGDKGVPKEPGHW